MNIHSKDRFKVLISAALVAGLSGCNIEPVRDGSEGQTGSPSALLPDQPDSGSDTGGTVSPPPPVQPDPTPDPAPKPTPDPTPDPTPTPDPAPEPVTTITLSGAVLGDRGQQYTVSLSDGKSEVKARTAETGGYQFELQLRQWQRQSSLSLTATDIDNPGMVFRHTLPNIDSLLLLDGDNNQLIDNQELLPLALSPASIAFDAVAQHLLGRSALSQSDREAAKRQMATHATLNQAFVRDLAQLLSETQAKPADSDVSALPLLGLTQTQLTAQLVGAKAATPNLSLGELYGQLADTRQITLPATAEAQLEASFTAGQTLNTLSAAYRWQESFYPVYTLRLSGAFPAELTDARVSVLIGAKPNDDTRGEYYYKPERPHRVIPLMLTDDTGRQTHRVNVKGQQHYTLTVRLHDTADGFSQCAPGFIGESWEGKMTDDNLQDLLTLQITDHSSNVELRSVLGPLCELIALDSNQDGTLDSSEYARTNIGYISSAQEVLLKKTTLASYGSFIDWKPLSIAEIDALMTPFPRQQTELLAAFAALQAKQSLFSEPVDLIESASFYQDLLGLVGINMQAEYSIVSNSNQIPQLNILQSLMGENAGLAQLLINHPDNNISHILKAATSLLADSTPDQAYFDNQPPPGRWVQVYPNSHLSPICQSSGLVSYDQVTGIAIVGQGVDSTSGQHWVTLDWQEQDYVSEYTLGWDTKPFTAITDAANRQQTSRTRATVSGLDKWQTYRIRIGTPGGSLSAELQYTPGRIHLNDTRITQGILGDDSTRGRDTQNQCDPLSGLAYNSNRDGELGARYIKLDTEGKRLPRQDLAWKQLKFSCVADANTGLIWETKSATDLEHPSLHDDLYYFSFDGKDSSIPFNGTCYNPDTGKLASDRTQCSAANQVTKVNESKLCGLSNWRLPSQQEIYGIMNLQGDQSTALDRSYFPNISGLKTTYFNWKDDQDKSRHETIYHGFWTANQHPLTAEALTRTVRPLKQRGNALTPNQQPHMIMLVSDGFSAQ
ncbi:DUF1566 domain-containing protein [Photobacterium sp. CAU 1568]|uniref:DUF1566 domain-containing protein n=1 Tax=Photobacterium arenosum TaxID=2774143 RepID=A0ABR9BLL6_9GAMM|nr:DUF1566 domain-containing protein [Photobacterium arenosum]